MKISFVRWGIFLAMLTVVLATSPPLPLKPRIEITSKSQRSVSARFRPTAGVTKYTVSIRRKYLADARDDAYMKFDKDDLNSDGYYYINVKRKLRPGQLYEISIYHGQRELTATVDFFTDCPKSKYQCMAQASHGETCISRKKLCDGEKDCQNGEDERKDTKKNCIAFQPVPNRPTPTSTTIIEILSKGQRSVSARFRPLPGVKKYTINVFVKFLADVAADYWVKLDTDEDLAPDGYFYVNAENKLKPGTLYEFAAFYGSVETAGSVDFFTDCPDREFQCEADTVLTQTCLERKQLCDGIVDCLGGLDEKKDTRGKCSVTIPTNSPPPSFPTGTKVEILSKGQKFVSARFRPLPGVKKYTVNIFIKYLADVSADYWTKLNQNDLSSDGYHYVNAVDALKPGKLYQFAVYYGSLETAGTADFFTDCRSSAFQCKTDGVLTETCLERKNLCDGTRDCLEGEDEEEDSRGKCLAKIPVFNPPLYPSIPPPPPLLPSKIKVEILSKSQTSVRARFQPIRGVTRYFISIHKKYLADVSADYWATLEKSDLNADGYYYIDANNQLTPGELYELSITYGKRLEMPVTVDFFTDCEKTKFQCLFDGASQQICLEEKELCDGTFDCKDKRDEEKDAKGNCLAKIPVFNPPFLPSFTPPPPLLPPKIKVEKLSKSQTSVRVRFQPIRDVTRYFISIHKKYLADVSADYWATLEKSDLDADGYYYIDANNQLTPGELYELSITYGKRLEMPVRVDFFTDCEKTKFQCLFDGASQQICLEEKELCDGTFDCIDKRDEEIDAKGNCKAHVQEKSETSCMKLMAIAKVAKRTDYANCDKNGYFPALHCKHLLAGYSCFCLDKYTGKNLATKHSYNPLVHYSYFINCLKLRQNNED